ncbi:hypothetical protein ASG29_15235 [Sphingomonas sp. Leaf412]|nr:hypothetical protein ASG29_15235 [Sphingomonas sp. Leaf412]
MSYPRLMRQHATIEALAADLLHIVQGPRCPEAAGATLRRLAMLIRDHHAEEERILSTTADLAARDRYDQAATAAMRDVVAQNEDWGAFVYRWCPGAIAADWPGFARAAQAMVADMHRRHAREIDILYSLGVHYGVLETAE